MKVLLIDIFLPENQYALELAKELRKNVDLTLFCRENAGDIESIVPCQKKLYSNGKNKVLAVYEYTRGLISLWRYMKQGFDVIHVQAMKFVQVESPLYIKSKRYGKILVHTAHNILPHEAKKADRQRYQKFYDACDLLIVHNERSKKQLLAEFGISEEKVAVVPHGIYGSMVPNKKKSSEKVVFLMFGMIREYKGIDIMLNAVALLPADIRERCEFIVAGKQYKNIDQNDYEIMAADLGIQSNCRFILRRIEDEEVPELFAETDACLFPYREIYGSGALLMAYTYQKPVLASNVPTFVEETENGSTGLLFESENPQSLAETIVKFVNLSEQQRKAYCTKIERLIKNKYNWSASAWKTASAYEEAMRRGVDS